VGEMNGGTNYNSWIKTKTRVLLMNG